MENYVCISLQIQYSPCRWNLLLKSNYFWREKEKLLIVYPKLHCSGFFHFASLFMRKFSFPKLSTLISNFYWNFEKQCHKCLEPFILLFVVVIWFVLFSCCFFVIFGIFVATVQFNFVIFCLKWIFMFRANNP